MKNCPMIKKIKIRLGHWKKILPVTTVSSSRNLAEDRNPWKKLKI